MADRLRGRGPIRDGIERPRQLADRDWNQVASDWQDHRNEIRNDWQDHRDEVRHDWQDWRDDHYPWHRGWYWGYAAGYWNRWDYLWDQYPVAATVGLTWWGANSLGYVFGCDGYYNPYYVDTGGYSYAEPIVIESYVSVEVQPAEPTQESLDKFGQAQAAFAQGTYSEALKLVDEAVVQWPRDAVLHEFRSLVLFALKRYGESAAAIHAVLAVGPGWDWKTLSSLYSNIDAYTSQLRALEAHCNANPKAADARFLLGYHYLTMGHGDAALTEFRMASELQPKDEVAASLVRSLSPRDTDSQRAPLPSPPTPIAANDLASSWGATGKDGSKYLMTISKKGTFVWNFTSGTRKEEVKGVYSIEGNVLAMEPETGGVLLAELTLKSSGNLLFKMVGSDKSDPGLEFQRSNG